LVDPEALALQASEAAGLLAPAAALGAPIVPISWLMDSVSSLERRDLEAYRYTAPGK
jgi:hypothetical protein